MPRGIAEPARAEGIPSALDGLRVVELGEGDALAYGGKLLADFGADLVKVEGPEGDPARRRPCATDRPGQDGALHRWLNTNKRSVVVDWRTDLERLRPLLDGADILLTSVPTSQWATAEGSTLAPDALRAGRDALIVAHVSDFGPDGPLAGWQGGELVLYALSGLLGA